MLGARPSARLAIASCAVWASVIMILLTVGGLTDPTLQTPSSRAMIGMIWGLFLIWVAGGGLLMLKIRDGIRTIVAVVNLDSRLKFFLFASGLSLLEEAVTTGMTNLAPMFGVPVGQAYITASANYLDVIAFHSVIVFLPMFAVWALLLNKYNFDPKMVMLLYGITGTLAEAFSFGPQNIVVAGLWILVYGLMAYLPAYSFTNIGQEKPRLVIGTFAVLAPIIAAIPVAVLVQLLFHRPAIEF